MLDPKSSRRSSAARARDQSPNVIHSGATPCDVMIGMNSMDSMDSMDGIVGVSPFLKLDSKPFPLEYIIYVHIRSGFKPSLNANLKENAVSVESHYVSCPAMLEPSNFLIVSGT